jgi:hypothetical protein
MQSGCSLFHVDVGEMKLVETQRFTDGNSNHLTYGLDLLNLVHKNDCKGPEFHMISCSFYDNIVETWTKEFST